MVEIRSLQGESFVIDVPTSHPLTIAQIKSQLRERNNKFEHCKLFYDRKILKNTETVGSLDIRPGSFLVCTSICTSIESLERPLYIEE